MKFQKVGTYVGRKLSISDEEPQVGRLYDSQRELLYYEFRG